VARRAVIGILGLLAFLVGLVFTGQGINLIHGSSMSGRASYAVLGIVLMLVGAALVASSWRLGRDSSKPANDER
jgi:hypothetical protein